MNYDNKLVAFRILDRKHVTLLLTAYNCKPTNTGKKCQMSQDNTYV